MSVILFSLEPALAGPTVLHAGIEDADNAPYGSLVDGSPQGFHVDVIENVAKNLHWIVTWRPLPWNRALAEIKSGALDAVPYMSASPDRKAFVDFHEGNELHRDSLCLIVREEDATKLQFDGTWESLKELKIGRPSGYWYSTGFQKAAPHLKVIEFNGTANQGMEMLALKRIDVYADSGRGLAGAIEQIRKKIPVTALKPCMPGDIRYVGFSKKAEGMGKEFALAMKKYRKTKSYKDLLQKYQIKPNI